MVAAAIARSYYYHYRRCKLFTFFGSKPKNTTTINGWRTASENVLAVRERCFNILNLQLLCLTTTFLTLQTARLPFSLLFIGWPATEGAILTAHSLVLIKLDYSIVNTQP